MYTYILFTKNAIFVSVKKKKKPATTKVIFYLESWILHAKKSLNVIFLGNFTTKKKAHGVWILIENQA